MSRRAAASLALFGVGGGICVVATQDLKFANRRGRAEERLEVALLIVDGAGKAGNGRSASIALSLTAEEQQRVRSTGVRWLSSFELPPGRRQLRVAVQATNTGASGMVTHTVDVPSYEPAVRRVPFQIVK